MAEASVLAAPGAYVADKSNKAVLAAAIGNLLEWYDFGVYAYLAGLIATKFFPSSDPTASLLAAFAAYGVGFLARPLGGIVIGRLGDTKGRKTALVLTIFLMAFGTVGLGLLPSYEAIGVWAPILLVALRIVQGLAAGGEWGTSTAFMVEWAPQNRRGLFGSFQQVSTAGGSLLGSAVAAIMTSSLSQAAMLDWGWRVPFLLGALLLFVGAYLRQNVDETPTYEELHPALCRAHALAGAVVEHDRPDRHGDRGSVLGRAVGQGRPQAAPDGERDQHRAALLSVVLADDQRHRARAGDATPDPARHPACALFGRGTRGDLGNLPDASALHLDVERLRALGRHLRRVRAVHRDLADPGHGIAGVADLSLSVAFGGDLAARDLEPEGNRWDKTELISRGLSSPSPCGEGSGVGVTFGEA